MCCLIFAETVALLQVLALCLPWRLGQADKLPQEHLGLGLVVWVAS